MHTVQEKFSIASEETANVSRIERGDAVESTEAAPSMQFASEWVEPKRKKKKSSSGHSSGKQ